MLTKFSIPRWTCWIPKYKVYSPQNEVIFTIVVKEVEVVAIGAPGVHIVVVPDGRPLVVKMSSQRSDALTRVLAATSMTGKHIYDPR